VATLAARSVRPGAKRRRMKCDHVTR
jgi:hypothetical protein